MLLVDDHAKQIQTANLFKAQLFQRLLDSFSNATKLFTAFTDVNGNYIITSNKEDCKFCKLIRSTSLGLAKCKQDYALAGAEALKWKEPYVFKCHAGLISWVCPVFLQGTQIGNLVCGSCMMWKPEEVHLEKIKNLAVQIGQDEKALLDSVNKVDIVSAKQIEAAADLIFIITNYISKDGVEIFNCQQQLRMIGSWLWKENKKAKHISELDPYDTEQDIIHLQNKIFYEIRQCNDGKAKELLQELALQFFTQSKGQVDIIKCRCLEFLSYLARLAAESGIKQEKLLNVSNLNLKELDDADTVEKAMLWLFSKGNEFIDLLAQKKPSSHEDVVSKAVYYIQQNYKLADLSVEEIAKASFISPAYLGRLFKKAKGCTITEYINKVRIEQSKLLLRETDQIIKTIAKNVGFKDRSYFSKTFKKYVGLSPNDYRRKSLSSSILKTNSIEKNNN
jgi:two-component system response regulator YesN